MKEREIESDQVKSKQVGKLDGVKKSGRINSKGAGLKENSSKVRKKAHKDKKNHKLKLKNPRQKGG